MRFDMHCHTREGSPDAKVPIEEYISILKSKGFDGMLVSDHDSYDGYRYWKEHIRGKKYTDFVVLRGVEYDTLDAGHFLVILPTGMELKVLEIKGMPVSLLIRVVHHCGGILGPAHPCGERYLSIFSTGIYKKKHGITKRFDFLEGFNACEETEDNNKAMEIAQRYRKAVFGGSDSHKIECVGKAYTDFDGPIRTENDLIRYIKCGKKTTVGGERFYGTTKDKLGIFNHALVQSFWFYNRFGALIKKKKRERGLNHVRQVAERRKQL